MLCVYVCACVCVCASVQLVRAPMCVFMAYSSKRFQFAGRSQDHQRDSGRQGRVDHSVLQKRQSPSRPSVSNYSRQSTSSYRENHRPVPNEEISRKRRKVYSPARSFSERTSYRSSNPKGDYRSQSNYRAERNCKFRGGGENSHDLSRPNGSLSNRSTNESSYYNDHRPSTASKRDRKKHENAPSKSTQSASRTNRSPIRRRSDHMLTSKKDERSQKSETPSSIYTKAVSVSPTSSSSSNDEKAIRMKLLKDKYDSGTKRRDSDDVSFVKQETQNQLDEEIFNSRLKERRKKSSSSGEKYRSEEVISGTSKKRRPHQESSTLTNGKDRHKAAKPKQRKALTHIKDDLEYDPVLLNKKYDEYKRKKDKNVAVSSSSSSSNSSSSSPSSSSSSETSPEVPAEVKRSRWNSGSSNDSSHKASESTAPSKPFGPPLADPEILKKIKPASRDSLIRQRNCKYCALFLKTKDDVDRHTMTHRHRVVTGEYFIDREYLIGPPYVGDKVQCTICNAPVGNGVSIDRHEDSSQHRQQLHRWMARQQPKPPIKYYIEPI